MVEISVIIPTFRRPRQLREAVTSVLGQDGASLEVLVVDDCPDGSAADAVRAIQDPRLRYLKNPRPSGGRPAAVRNVGWPHACGSFVHFLDDDDIVPAGHYAAATAAFRKRPNIGVVFGRIEPFGDDERELARERAFFASARRRAASACRFGPRWAFTARLLFDDALLVCSAGVVRRECVIALDGFDPGLPLMEDVDFFARAIRRFGAHFMDRVVLRYRIWPSLMHRPAVQAEIEQSYTDMHANYRTRWGAVDFFSLKVFARVLKLARNGD